MKALLIGGAGFIGSHLADALLAGGDEVRVLSRRPERFRQPPPGVEYLAGDAADARLLDQALQGADVVYHLASATVPLTAERDMIGNVEHNLFPTLHLLDAMVRRQVPRIVFFSSGGTVYGPARSIPIAEDHPTDPIGAHGVAKLMIEKHLRLYAHHYQLEYQILRVANAYGERQNPGGQQGIVAVAMGRLLRGEPIDIWGDGSAVRDYVYAGDVAAAAVLAARSPQPQALYNIGSGVGTALLDLLRQIETLSGRPLRLRFGPAKPYDVPIHTLDISHAAAGLGWRPATPLAAGLARAWRWFAEEWKGANDG
ncbi:MAG TPA: NAD-dependent epimerase/dehydratase family protein [Herpetosiphonaceae bacterium]